VATVGLVPGIIIGLREGMEAALLVGIILAYLTKIGQRSFHRYVWGGVAVAVAASVTVGAALLALTVEFEGTAEQLFEGFAMILAVVVLTSMIFWMMQAAKNIRKHVEQRIDTLVDRRRVYGLAALSFIVVFREGVETALFMLGLGAGTTPFDAATGVTLGLAVAAVLGFGLIRFSWRVNLRTFFAATSVLLIVIAAGLFAYGVYELQGAYGVGFASTEVYNLKAVFPDTADNPAGYLLRGIVGYNDNPTQLEAGAYLAYWGFVGFLYWAIRTGRVAGFVRPFARLWRRLQRASLSRPEEMAE
jgi:high-affinity iron transporter